MVAPALILVGFSCISSVISVPILSESPSNKLEDLDEVEVIDDDFTTRSLERLSSAATCLVAGVEYTHGQQINRADPCEFCLCLDGEMFCWWQDCPPATDGPCKDQGPFSQCENVVVTKTTTKKPLNTKNTTKSKNDLGNAAQTSTTKTTETSSETGTVLATSSPKFCIVMGIQYRIGDKLPHDTGNCVECICGEGAQITCSPHQCAPLGEEITDYRPPEPRLTNLESF